MPPPGERVPDTIQALENVQNVWSRLKENSPIYQLLLSDIKIATASTAGRVMAYLTVKPVHLNSKGSVHGTVSACLVDWAGGMAIAATGLDKTGVSTDIHTTYVSTAGEGAFLEIEAEAKKVGKTLAFTTVEIRKMGDDGARDIVATGTHTKYVKR
ncbi:hypothetical protein ACLMJK_009575 [Lecanora helva]